MKEARSPGRTPYLLAAGIVLVLVLGIVRLSVFDRPTGAPTPEGALRSYYRALDAGDCRRAARFIHPEFQGKDELCAQFRQTQMLSGTLLGVVSTEVNGDRARMLARREVEGVKDRRIVRARRTAGLWRLSGGSSCYPAQRPTDLGRSHLEPEQRFDDYSSFPPTSGPHDPQPAAAGVIYEEPQPLPALVHSMEHGTVVFWIGTASEQMRDRLLGVVQELFGVGYEAVIVTPLPVLQVPFAMTAWGVLQRCLGVAPLEIRSFVTGHYASGPEGRLACGGRAAHRPPCAVSET